MDKEVKVAIEVCEKIRLHTVCTFICNITYIKEASSNQVKVGGLIYPS